MQLIRFGEGNEEEIKKADGEFPSPKEFILESLIFLAEYDRYTDDGFKLT